MDKLNELEEVATEMCDKYCKYPNEYDGEGELFEYICEHCPLNKYLEKNLGKE